MPKSNKGGFYAVHSGQRPGVYLSWEDCEKQIKGYPKAQFKKFHKEAEALAFVQHGASAGKAALAASTGGSGGPTTLANARPNSKRKKSQVADIVDESRWDVVYTDGACQGNGQEGAVAGIGVWWGDNDARNLSERCPGDQTNNRAELIAIVRALETTQSNKRLLIKTDSSYSIQCVRDWIPNWRKRGWKTSDGKDVKNKAVITYLSYLLDERGRKGFTVQLQHVRGHVGIRGNEGADYLAGLGAFKPVTPERDWALPTQRDAKDLEKDVSLTLTGEDALWSPEEIKRMVESGEFD